MSAKGFESFKAPFEGEQSAEKEEQSAEEGFKKKQARRANTLLVNAMAGEELSAADLQSAVEVAREKSNLHLHLSAMTRTEEGEAAERAAAEENLTEMMSPHEEDSACAAAAPPTKTLDPDTRMGHFRGTVELELEHPELAAIAERELGETPAVRASALKELRARLVKLEQEGVTKTRYLWKRDSKSPIAFARKDDQFLICFLRARKFRVDDAERLVVNYTNFVHKHAEILTSLDDRDPFLDPAVIGPMGGIYLPPGTTRAGGRLFGISMKKINKSVLDNLTVEEHRNDYFKMLVRQTIRIYTMQLSDPWFQVKGVFMIQDWEDGLSLAQIYKSDLLSLRQKKDALGLLHDTIPMRFNGVVMLNQPLYISVFLNLIKPFMNEKIRKRIYLLGDDVDALHALVDPKQLPVEMHGTMDYAPIREKLKGFLPKWQLHAGNWEEIGISASHVDKHVAPGLDENSPPPYNGSKKVEQWIASRRNGGDGDAEKKGKKTQRRRNTLFSRVWTT